MSSDGAEHVDVVVPSMGLVVLVGVSGSGKSTFAARHFKPTEVISSDFCRGLVSDDENDQSATRDAFDVLNYIVGTRLRRGLLTVVDATNVQPAARRALVKLARDHDVLVVAVVLDVPDSVALGRNHERPDREFGSHVVSRQQRDLKRSLGKLKREGFRRVHVLKGVEQIDAARVSRQRPWNDRSDVHGPFDIIGDVHGRASELRALRAELGWELEYRDGEPVCASHPDDRTAVFVGDLVDRGPDTPGVLRLVMGMVHAGTAMVVSGNHEAKLVRALKGANVTVSHGLAESLEQLAAQPDSFRDAALDFLDGLISHYVLDDGKLVVAHAGLKEAYHGRSSGRVRSFALYGDTTGETDEYGLPVRYPWAQEYRGSALVVYGHTPVPETEWVNDTICIDTGVVFGGSLTALRYPEREIVQVPAEQEWYTPARPLAAPSRDRQPSVLRIDDVAGGRWLETAYAGKVKERAFEEYAGAGVSRVVCEEKHMGSRAVAVLARDPQVAERRFGVSDGTSGVVYTRTGRPFFPITTELVDRLTQAVGPLFESLQSDWLALDCELLPWSAKAASLIKDQYASVGTAARHALPAALQTLEAAAVRGLDVAAQRARARHRQANAEAFRAAYAAHCLPNDGLEGVTLAPFQILAAEGRALALSETHEWHLAQLSGLAGDLITPTRHRFVDLGSEQERAAAVGWWLELTSTGGEGFVVKPAHLTEARVQPGLKVRGREYLRIVYGPDYTDSLDLLRDRHLGKMRNLALREHGLGLEALTGFVGHEPLWRVHQLVFAVLALESEPVDPRL